MITLVSCTSSDTNLDQKIARDTALIYKLFEIQNSQNILEASKLYLRNASFNSFVGADTKLTNKGYVYDFYNTEVAEEKESYSDLLFEFFDLFNHSKEDLMIIEIDSIQVDSIKYRVYQTIKSPLLEEYFYAFPKKNEDFYIKNDTITKISLQSIDINTQTANFTSNIAYWIMTFTRKEVFDYKSIILGKADDEFKKSVIKNYRNYITFLQDSLDENFDYTFYKNLQNLHQKAFLTHELDDVAIELYMEFKGIELYYDPAIHEDDDFTKLVHLNFSQNGVEISCVTRVQDSTAFTHLKPNQKCAVFGLGAKNMVGELQLRDVVVYNYSIK